MPSDRSESHSHFAWQLLPARIAQDRLEAVGLKAPDTSASDEVAVLYAYASDKIPAPIASMPCHAEHRNRLQREATVRNHLAYWLERSHHAGIWKLAAVWQFYRDWLSGWDIADWESRLTHRFDVRPFADALLAPSGGWIIWKHQVQLLCGAALHDPDIAMQAANAWMSQAADMASFISNAVLPDGVPLANVLNERAYLDRAGALMACTHPDLTVAYRLLTLR